MQPDVAENGGQVENVRVFIRVRPLNVQEQRQALKTIVNVKPNENSIVLKKPGALDERWFQFSKIFDQESSQMELYRYIAVPIVQKVMEGYNGTIFAYGQSGTGKTHTMIGHPIQTELKGIVPNIFDQIFTEISMAKHDVSYVVTATYLEIYNEEVRDLLASKSNQKLVIRERSDIGVYVKDLLGFTVDSLDVVTDLLVRGNKNRMMDSTRLNRTSSRSHAIFTILVESKNCENNKTSFGKLNLVDLAGSERVSKTLATGDRLKEAGKINLSLSVLGNVISALVDGKSTHIPYRNSKLTRLLQDSLGGNSMTTMIALVSPSEHDYDESVYTLMYADRVKHIQNYVSVNLEKQNVIEKFEMKIKELQQQLIGLSIEERKNVQQQESKKCSSRSSKRGQEELEKIEEEKSMLLQNIQMIQKKILVGGVNLFEKAEEQQNLLDNTAREIEVLDNSHQELTQALQCKSEEISSVSKNYSSLQEEDRELSLAIEEAEKVIIRSRKILLNKEHEYQNEISNLLFTNKCLAREMGLVNVIVANCMAKDDLLKINSNLVYDEESQDWKIKGIAYAGNNLKKKKSKSMDRLQKQPEHVYFDYSGC